MEGHKLVELTSNGERSLSERCWTGVCSCGWMEGAHSRKETRNEFNIHLIRVMINAGQVDELLKARENGWYITDNDLEQARRVLPSAGMTQ